MRSVLKPKDPNLIVDEVSRMSFEELASIALSATKLENFSVVEMILNANINHKVKSFILNECFVLACKHGDYRLLDKFVAYGSDVNVYDGKPLIMACAYGNIETVRVLLRLGADVHKRDDMAFEQACSNCQADVMRELILHGVKYNKKWDILLRNACRMDSGVVLVLLQNGADVNKGHPIMEAIRYDMLYITKLLIDNGARVNKRMVKVAKSQGFYRIAQLLELEMFDQQW